MEMFGVTRTLSLTPSWSAMKASLGAVSGVVVEVTHIVPSPGIRLVAVQSAGKAGAVTPSKFSLKTVGPQVGVGVTVPPAVAVDVAVGVAVAAPVAVAVAVAVTVAVGVGVPGVPLGVGL